MTQQFHEGQEVEVFAPYRFIDAGAASGDWRKAKIVGSTGLSHTEWMVEFRDGTRDVFHEAHIRAIEHIGVASGWPSGTQRVRFEP